MTIALASMIQNIMSCITFLLLDCLQEILQGLSQPCHFKNIYFKYLILQTLIDDEGSLSQSYPAPSVVESKSSLSKKDVDYKET